MYGLMYGLYSRAASNQERPMMARVRYILLFDYASDKLLGQKRKIYDFINSFLFYLTFSETKVVKASQFHHHACFYTMGGISQNLSKNYI